MRSSQHSQMNTHMAGGDNNYNASQNHADGKSHYDSDDGWIDICPARIVTPSAPPSQFAASSANHNETKGHNPQNTTVQEPRSVTTDSPLPQVPPEPERKVADEIAKYDDDGFSDDGWGRNPPPKRSTITDVSTKGHVNVVDVDNNNTIVNTVQPQNSAQQQAPYPAGTLLIPQIPSTVNKFDSDEDDGWGPTQKNSTRTVSSAPLPLPKRESATESTTIIVPHKEESSMQKGISFNSSSLQRAVPEHTAGINYDDCSQMKTTTKTVVLPTPLSKLDTSNTHTQKSHVMASNHTTANPEKRVIFAGEGGSRSNGTNCTSTINKLNSHMQQLELHPTKRYEYEEVEKHNDDGRDDRDEKLSLMKLLNLEDYHGKNTSDMPRVHNVYAKYHKSWIFSAGSNPMSICYDVENSLFLVPLQRTNEVKCFDHQDMFASIIDKQKFPRLLEPSAVTVVVPGSKYAVLDCCHIIMCIFNEEKSNVDDKSNSVFDYSIVTNLVGGCRGLATTPSGKIVTTKKTELLVFDEKEGLLYKVNYTCNLPPINPCFMNCSGNHLLVTDLGHGGMIYVFKIVSHPQSDGSVEERVEFSFYQNNRVEKALKLGHFQFISGVQVDANEWSIIGDAKKPSSIQIFNDLMFPVAFVKFEAPYLQDFTSGVCVSGNGYLALSYRHKGTVSIYKLERRGGTPTPSFENVHKKKIESGGMGVHGMHPHMGTVNKFENMTHNLGPAPLFPVPANAVVNFDYSQSIPRIGASSTSGGLPTTTNGFAQGTPYVVYPLIATTTTPFNATAPSFVPAAVLSAATSSAASGQVQSGFGVAHTSAPNAQTPRGATVGSAAQPSPLVFGGTPGGGGTHTSSNLLHRPTTSGAPKDGGSLGFSSTAGQTTSSSFFREVSSNGVGVSSYQGSTSVAQPKEVRFNEMVAYEPTRGTIPTKGGFDFGGAPSGTTNVMGSRDSINPFSDPSPSGSNPFSNVPSVVNQKPLPQPILKTATKPSAWFEQNQRRNNPC